MDNISKKELEFIVENANEIFYRSDINGNIIYVSPQIENFGITPDEVIKNGVISYLHFDDIDHALNDFKKTLETGEEFPTEFRLINKDGKTYWFEDLGKIVYDEFGEVSGLIGTLLVSNIIYGSINFRFSS